MWEYCGLHKLLWASLPTRYYTCLVLARNLPSACEVFGLKTRLLPTRNYIPGTKKGRVWKRKLIIIHWKIESDSKYHCTNISVQLPTSANKGLCVYLHVHTCIVTPSTTHYCTKTWMYITTHKEVATWQRCTLYTQSYSYLPHCFYKPTTKEGRW